MIFNFLTQIKIRFFGVYETYYSQIMVVHACSPNIQKANTEVSQD